jgi:hypothetical protein
VFPLRAPAGWVQDFKEKHRIGKRHITKYISRKKNATFEGTVKKLNVFKNV